MDKITFKKLPVKLSKTDAKTLQPVSTPGWSSSEERVLILIDKPDKVDVKTQELMTPSIGSGRDTKVNTTYNSIVGVINYGLSKNPNKRNECSFAVAQFDNSSALELIDKLNPTKVFAMSLKALALFPSKQTLRYTLGNPVRKDGVSYTFSLPLDQLIKNKLDTLESSEDINSSADLLYFVCRNFDNCLKGKNPYSLKDLVPNPILVDSVELLKELFVKLEKYDVVGVDLETSNLSSYHNKLYTAQFAFNETEGYVLPIRIPSTCFSEKILLKIERRLTEFFGRKDNLKNLVFFNGKFDQRVLRATLGINLINHNIWEVTAGEHDLDENLALFNKKSFDGANNERIKLKFGNLRNLMCHYGNDKYYTLPFSKEQRATISHIDITTNKDALDYCALDAQSNFALRVKQLARAAALKIRYKGEVVPYSEIYEKHVVHQMGVTTKALSTMEQYGSYLDIPYLKELMHPKDSPLVKLLAELKEELLGFQSVQEAATKISQTTGVKAASLFGASLNATVFEIKPAHLAILFFDVLKCKPISYTATGKPSVDKDFLAAYADTIPEARVLAEYSEAKKLLSTYVGSWYESVMSDPDGRVDHCLRPSFGFFDVVTGRLSSFDPNLQNVPTRGKLAKLIKRMFIAPVGHLLPRWDFSAHEVRMWGNVSKDVNVAASFNAGYDLRKKLIVNPTDEVKKELKQKGDFHILNVRRFFNKWIEKSDPLRDAIKGVVFGVIYGKSAKTLGKDLQNQKLKELSSKIKDLKKKIAAL